MAIIRNAANRKLNGRIGDTTYYTSMGRQIARQSQNSTNWGETARRSPLQQRRRVMWANLVNFYKVSSEWMPKAFENKRQGQTDYNRFVSVNISSARIALTKSEALQSACVIDSFIVSQGSIPSVTIVPTATAFKSSIAVGSLTIGSTTTVGQFSSAVLDANSMLQEGMQISFVSYQQAVESSGLPLAVCTFYEVTLDKASTEFLRDYLPEFCSQSTDGVLATSADVSVGGFAYIISDRRNGILRVSTQQLITKNSSLINRFSSDNQVTAAIESYGVDNEVLLTPGSISHEEPTPQPRNIISISTDSHPAAIYAGQMVGTMADIMDKEDGTLYIQTSGIDLTDVASVRVGAIGGVSVTAASKITQSGSQLVITAENMETGGWWDLPLQSVNVVMATSGDVVSINFATA